MKANMKPARLIVIGGNAAGMSAAAKAKRLQENLSVSVFETGPHVSYAPWGIPYFVGGVVDEEARLIERTPEEFLEKQGIQVYTRQRVQEIDAAGRRVRVASGDSGKQGWEGFDHLMIATGATPFLPDVPGKEGAGIHVVNTLQSGLGIDRDIREHAAKRAVVVGAGYIGLEMAEALFLRGLDVSLVNRSQVMGTFDPDMGAKISDAVSRMGVRVFTGETLEAFEVQNGRVCAVVTDAQTHPADLVVMGLGVRPNTALAREAGIELGPTGAIAVNARMQTGDPAIWAGGDCAESFHRVSRRPAYVPLGTVAARHGRTAGTNIGGGSAVFPGVLGTAASKICGLEVARTGLQEKELEELGLQYVTETIHSTTQAGYLPDAGEITVKLLGETGSGRLLGAQIVGGEGAAKRIDVAAAALHAELPVAEVEDLDLSYAPPFSPLWDPVIIAARQLQKKL